MISNRNAARVAALAAALAVVPTVFAQDTGWYAGGSVGRSTATIDDDRITRGLAGQGLAVTGMDHRDREVGYKLFGGYQLNRHFGVEAGWFQLGEMGYTATTSPAGRLTGDVKLHGLNLDLVGKLPISERFSLLGRVGIVHTRAKGQFAAAGAVTNPYSGTSTSDSNTGVKFGAGVAWRIADAWELRAEAERVRIGDSVGNKGHVDLFSVGVVYRFGAPGRRV